jgi:hypothetical protein
MGVFQVPRVLGAMQCTENEIKMVFTTFHKIKGPSNGDERPGMDPVAKQANSYVAAMAPQPAFRIIIALFEVQRPGLKRAANDDPHDVNASVR